MNRDRTRYFVEGDCEKKLIDDLKRVSILPPGKTVVFNVLTKVISKSRLMDIHSGSIVILVFDTDGEQDISILKRNIELFEKHVNNVRIINLISVRNFEEELIKTTRIKRIEDLTNCRSSSDFKSSFLRLKSCLPVLEKNGFDIKKMWCSKPDGAFSELHQGFSEIRK